MADISRHGYLAISSVSDAYLAASPGTNGGCFYARHNNHTNLVWSDGHASSMSFNDLRSTINSVNTSGESTGTKAKRWASGEY
jgi:prepilin-type processing-associated H-X9-DG protein